MLRTLLLILSGLLALTVVSCSLGDRDTSDPVGPNPNPGPTDLILPVGATETLSAYGLELRFDTVLSDSRCPIGAVCFWQGVARLILKVESSDNDRQRVLFEAEGALPSRPTSRIVTTDVGQFRIELIELSPYPELDIALPYNSYAAKLKVTPYSAPDPVTGEVVLSRLPIGELKADGIIIDSVWVEDSHVRMTVWHSGGCRIHQYTLFMDPPAFMLSNPVQANLYLQHFGDDDACRALIRRELRFDLQPLLDLHQSPSGRLDPILLNVHHLPDMNWTLRKQVRYEPEGYAAPTILPLELGTYWVYADTIRTNGRYRSSVDTVEVIGRRTDSTGDWWILSRQLLTLGNQIMVKGDSIYTMQHGYMRDYSEREYIPAQTMPVTYSMILQGDLWYERTVTLHNATVEVPLGQFDTSYRYDCTWMCTTPMEQYLVPGVGFILQVQPECEIGPGLMYERRTVLIEHGTGL